MCYIYLSINEGMTMLGTKTRKFTRATHSDISPCLLIQSNLRGWIFLRLYKRQSTCELSLLVFHPATNTVLVILGNPFPLHGAQQALIQPDMSSCRREKTLSQRTKHNLRSLEPGLQPTTSITLSS